MTFSDRLVGLFMHAAIEKYLKDLEQELALGKTTEHSHRPALKTFFESFGNGIVATNEPKREKCGAPDYLVTKPGPFIVGYVETKDIGKSLDDAEKSDQLKRYLTLENLLLTDYIKFRSYVNGKPRFTAVLSKTVKGGKITRDPALATEVESLVSDFLSHAPQQIATPKELAERLAHLAHIIRDIIVNAFDNKIASPGLKDLRNAFATTLIPDLDLPKKTGEFADMYAQTIAYGLFAARCNHQNGKTFKRLGAATEIPKTNPFLRRIFETITSTELNDEPYVDFVDDLVQLLANSDIQEILKDFGKRTKQQDPVVHFYETFLASYDPEIREKRGVYYTPEPVVSYIVRSIDRLLKSGFSLASGLSDMGTVTYQWQDTGKTSSNQATVPKVLVLDPACGTGTFLYYIIDHIRDVFIQKGNAGLWASFIEDQLLHRLHGFELLMAPYAVAHFKLALQLAGQDLPDKERAKWAYSFTKDDRLSVYLTNTLEEIEHAPPTLYGPLRVITEEAQAANHVKKEMPILVVLGNPPYSGQSANRSWKLKDGKRMLTFVGQLIRDYYVVDGKPLGERNPKWLQDDYVKFIRWGQWKIDRSGAGILAFISNHGYLDNPTFRGMRQSLLHSFTDVFIFDLHGNSKKKEIAPDGSFDKNVFDIRQGVAIGIFVKRPEGTYPGNVHHAHLWGTREQKYKELFAHDVTNTNWVPLSPKTPYYWFIPVDTKLESEYQRGLGLRDLFQVTSVGIVTARDALTIKFMADEMWSTVTSFTTLPVEDARTTFKLGDDAAEWTIAEAQTELAKRELTKERVVPIQYRPFDRRFTYYTGLSGFIGRPRSEVMSNLLKHSNVAIHVCRQVVSDVYQHAIATRLITDDCYVSNITRERGYTLPLYVDAPGFSFDLWPRNADGQQANFTLASITEIEKRMEASFAHTEDTTAPTFTPESLLSYIYAILYSPTFRERYFQFLKQDFPRIPFPSDLEVFQSIAVLGSRLIELHTMSADDVNIDEVHYPIPGNHLVAKGHPKFLDLDLATGKPLESGRVYINKSEYFEGITSDIWEFEMGSYQVCEKWLKDRKGRILTLDELNVYRRIVVSVRETIQIMDQIDEAIPHWPMP